MIDLKREKDINRENLAEWMESVVMRLIDEQKFIELKATVRSAIEGLRG